MIGFFPALSLLFIGLKLGGVLAWSWLWVLAPLWLPTAVIVGIPLVGFMAIAVGLCIAGGNKA